MEEKSNYPSKLEDQEEEEEEDQETLSFCDLPIYSHAAAAATAEPENLSKESSLSSPDDQEDLFQFFSQDWRTTTSSSTTTCVVFCGKFIPFREPPLIIPGPTAKPESVNKPQQKTKKKRRLFRWNLRLFSRRHRASKGEAKYGFLARRVPVLEPAAKSRWHYLMMFGLAKLPAEMELTDIRRRQTRRRSPSAMFRPSGGDQDERVSRGKVLWGLIRVLGCGGYHHLHHDDANAVVTA